MSAYSNKGGYEHLSVETGSNTHISSKHKLAALPRRYVRLVSAIFLSFALWALAQRLFHAESAKLTDTDNEPKFPQALEANDTQRGLPPLYEAYRRYEDEVSERNIQGQNETRRYIFFANQAHGCGWGNVLQEIVFNALLAAEAKLGYVWHDYTWSKGSAYSVFNGKTIPARIPLSTMISGHMLGRSSDDHLPPSISSRVFDRICPVEERTLIHRQMVEDFLGNTIELGTAEGADVLRGWLSFLEQPELKKSRCIEVKVDTLAAFDIWLFGSTRIWSLWPALSKSPVLKYWNFSPLIRNMFSKNVAFFSPHEIPSSGIARFLSPFFSRDRNTSCPGDTPHTQDPLVRDESTRLPALVLHLRRGDFAEHCGNLAGWNASYTGFNAFPQFRTRDVFVPPGIAGEVHNADGAKMVSSLEEKKAEYLPHCFPDIPVIVRRVREAVHDYARALAEKERREKEARGFSRWWSGPSRAPRPQERLRKIYVMTNGDAAWLAAVKQALLDDLTGPQSGDWEFEWSWEGIATSRDLTLGWEEKPVAQALDMYVAQRAELFIGNGFSSLTSNIVMLRMMNPEIDPVQTRFW